VADTELGEVFEQAEYPQDPKDDSNHNNGIQDALDLALHGDEAVHKPQQQADDAECDNNGDKGHWVFSFRSAEADKNSEGLSIGTASFGVVRFRLDSPRKLLHAVRVAGRERRRMRSEVASETKPGNAATRPSL